MKSTVDLDKCATIFKQGIALVALNAFGFYFDDKWIYAAIAVDILVLGYDVKSIVNGKKTTKSD